MILSKVIKEVKFFIIKKNIKKCIDRLYKLDSSLFKKNHGEGVCERCVLFRLAYYLQNYFIKYDVDCDYNSSYVSYTDSNGYIIKEERKGKPIRNKDGTFKKRFIDIIIHIRNSKPPINYLCFEIKKWNNRDSKNPKKDFNNLEKLTSDYKYQYGFYILLGKNRKNTKWTIFEEGRIIEKNFRI